MLIAGCNTIKQGRISTINKNKVDQNGKKTGIWIIKEENRIDLYKYKNGLKQGKYRSYFENGNLSIKGHFINDEKNSRFVTYTGAHYLLFFRSKASILIYKKGKYIKGKTYNKGL